MINIESAKVAFDDFVSKYDISDERIKLSMIILIEFVSKV